MLEIHAISYPLPTSLLFISNLEVLIEDFASDAMFASPQQGQHIMGVPMTFRMLKPSEKHKSERYRVN